MDYFIRLNSSILLDNSVILGLDSKIDDIVKMIEDNLHVMAI